VFEVSSISSDTGAQPSTPHGRLPRRCTPEQIMQQSGAAEVRILRENLYKFKIYEDKKLFRKFSDRLKGWKVKSLDKLLNKLRHSSSKTRRTGSS